MAALPAAALCRVALDSLAREWPYRPDVSMQSEHDFTLPRARHPLFHTSYDWHSCVHMHWSLVRLLRLHRAALEPVQVDAITARFDGAFTVDAVATEALLFDQPIGPLQLLGMAIVGVAVGVWLARDPGEPEEHATVLESTNT